MLLFDPMTTEAFFTEIDGGITAPKGFLACSGYAGIKAGNTDKPDIALIYSETPSVGAATFTTNKVKAAPVRVSSAYLRSAETRAIVANSGNANACTGPEGIEHSKRTCKAVASALGINERQVMVCSTGRIGVSLPIEKMEKAIAELPGRLTASGSLAAAQAIMTSDTVPKQAAVEIELGGKKVRIGGIAKGAGMIDPNMATMLSFITTDASINKADLQAALSEAVENSFNRITIDGDMSTNDTVIALANGQSANTRLVRGRGEFQRFKAALTHVCFTLARMIVEDGEGVTKFVEIIVRGAKTQEDARKAASAVANSTLAKCAWFGGDPNWGRIMDALGYSGARVREEMVDLYYDGVLAVRNGMLSQTPFEKLRAIVAKPRFSITADLHLGDEAYTVYTTDLSTRYVELNMGE